MKGTLYLIPSTLGDDSPLTVLPALIPDIIKDLKVFIVEDIRSSRRFLKKIHPSVIYDELSFEILNEHTKEDEIPGMLAPLDEGKDAGLLSEAGLPCVADPGAALVGYAHEQGIRVVPLPGPSSIFLALMASGFNGQNFSFNGYLPIDKKERITKIRELEVNAIQKMQTQIFIETPYRNYQLMEMLLAVCRAQTKISIAYDLTLPGEKVITLTVAQWKTRKLPEFQKKPAVFLIYH